MGPHPAQEKLEDTGNLISQHALNNSNNLGTQNKPKPGLIWIRRMIIQVPLLIGLIISILFAILIHHIAEKESKYFENIFLQQDIALANSFSANPEFYLSHEQQDVFTHLLKGWTAAIPSIESVTICNNNGSVISHYSIDVHHNNEPCNHLPEYKQTKPHHITNKHDGYITAYHPIINSTGFSILKVIRGESVISDLKKYIYEDNITDGSVVIALAIFVSAIILLPLLRRINRAAEFAYNLSENTGNRLKESENMVEIHNLEKGLNNASTALYHKNNTLIDTCNSLEKQRSELLELKNNLEEKVNDRVHDLNMLNAELERSNKVKSEFMSLVSHELRSPLTSIKSFSEIMLDELDNHNYDPETSREYLNIINNETSRLARLINDILDLQKINEEKMIWRDTPNDFHKITKEAVKLFSEAFRKKGIELEIVIRNDLPLINIDADKAKQVFANLLSNALKFSADGKVEVILSHHDDGGISEILIAVTDNGPGVPNDEIDKIFGRFYQIERNRQTCVVGSGLGLNICWEIVSHYQGKIWVESNGANGSTFYIVLPVERKERKPLGEILVESGTITKDHLVKALIKQKEIN